MRMVGILIAVLLLALAAVSADASSALMFVYASPNGSDAWSGLLDRPNKARTDGPVKTLQRALQVAREVRSDEGFIVVPDIRLQTGTYFLDKPLELGVADSRLFIEADFGAKVTISGGKPITGFREVTVNGRKMLAADIPEVREGKWNFTQLFVNGRRRPRTRLPKEGFYRVAGLPDVTKETQWSVGQDRFTFNEGEFKQWKNLSDVDVVSFTLWVESRMPVKSVDGASRTVQLGKKSTFRLSEDLNATPHARYVIENVFEALDTPGQWYLDRPTGTLYYYPYVGEDTKNLTVIAPKLERLVTIKGSSTWLAKDITFSGIRFAHTEYTLPADSAGSSQAAFGVPGAIYFERAENCIIRNCEISHIGNYAIEFGSGCSGCAVKSNRITDLGAGGIKVNEGSDHITVSDNEIGDGGKIFASAIGVWIGNSPYNQVANNDIHDFYYTGVSVGWRWGYGESKENHTMVEFNHIHDIGKGWLSDMGGIYHLGVAPGTTLRGNRIHDVQSAGYGGWGIYTDEGSTDVLIEKNIVYRTKTGGFHQHYGKENTVRNNIFAFAKEHQLQRSREEEHSSFTFERNIVYYDEGILLGNVWANDHYKMDYNLYWDASGRPVTFAGVSFADWQKRHDQHSLIADPKFVDPKHDNFTLAADSPALKLGFKPIEGTKVGPTGPIGPGKP